MKEIDDFIKEKHAQKEHNSIEFSKIKSAICQLNAQFRSKQDKFDRLRSEQQELKEIHDGKEEEMRQLRLKNSDLVKKVHALISSKTPNKPRTSSRRR